MAISLLQAAAIAPLAPLADALSLAHARTPQNTAGFEYGWVRGVGSAAFVAGTLAASQVADRYGFSAIMWLSATALLAFPLVAKFVPEFPARRTDGSRHNEHPDHPWLMLLRQRVFGLVTLAHSKVRFVGEAIAVGIAATRAEAEDLLALVCSPVGSHSAAVLRQ